MWRNLVPQKYSETSKCLTVSIFIVEQPNHKRKQYLLLKSPWFLPSYSYHPENLDPFHTSFPFFPLLTYLPFDVLKSVDHHRIQIIQPTICSIFTSLLLDVYVWLRMFRASPRPSSGAYNCTGSLWFYRLREAAGALLVVVSNRFSPTVKPEAPSTVVRSWWWTGRCPKHSEPHINVK